MANLAESFKSTSVYAPYVKSPWIQTELVEKAAKEYALAHRYEGAVGGWIYRLDSEGVATHAVCQGWFNFWTMFRRQIEDWYTLRLTASSSFDAFVHPESKTYRPTLLVRGPRDWRYAFLANAYDVAMKNQGDARRAYVGSSPAPAPAPKPVSVWLSRVVAGASR